MKPVFFDGPAPFRTWLEKNHAKAPHLWVGFHKRHTGKPSMTWPQSVDQALCFGWIDGLRKSLGADAYMIRFSPRQPSSIWSNINTKRLAVLEKEGLMRPAGRAAFKRKKANKAGIYSFENRPRELPPKYARIVRGNAEAWADLKARPPWYRRTTAWWIVSAKKEETRLKRLTILIEHCARGIAIPPLSSGKT